ncbi:MAG TPA: hypothetical protein PKJ39_04920 [Caldisericia bacterium]|nr:hypothetical protein [Caldisericia bacterium]HQL66450.1 hypothetical protein [Caldisericia bacterium]
MKKIITLIIIVFIFYLFIFFMSRDSKPEFILGTGWKYFETENKKEEREILIGKIETGDFIFFKKIKIYPEIKGLLSYDLKQKLTQIDIDKPFSTEVSLISQNKEGNIYVKIDYEIIEGDAINYIFNLPIRIEKIKIEKPINLIETYIE